MRLATIDLGSNTVHLLVADVGAGAGHWKVVEAQQRVTRLGEGLAASGRLGAAPSARTAAAVADYVRRASSHGAERVRIVATSAVREAANGRDFAAAVQRATGQRVDIISGEEEARLTLRGVLLGLGARADHGATLVFDIGGGSTEYVLAREGRLAASVSLRLGVVPLAEAFPFPGPVDWPRYGALRVHVAKRLARELPDAIRGARADTLVGTAGTVTTLAALDLALSAYDRQRVQGHTLTRQATERLLALLGARSAAERAALPCMEAARADIILTGTAVVLETMTCLDTAALMVSDFGLREGVLAALAEAAC